MYVKYALPWDSNIHEEANHSVMEFALFRLIENLSIVMFYLFGCSNVHGKVNNSVMKLNPSHSIENRFMINVPFWDSTMSVKKWTTLQ